MTPSKLAEVFNPPTRQFTATPSFPPGAEMEDPAAPDSSPIGMVGVPPTRLCKVTWLARLILAFGYPAALLQRKFPPSLVMALIWPVKADQLPLRSVRT